VLVDWREIVFRLQPFLRNALKYGFVEIGVDRFPAWDQVVDGVVERWEGVVLTDVAR
jgi:hypothetical protein